MGDDGAAGSCPAAPSHSAYREIAVALGPMYAAAREREASRSSKSPPANAVRPEILHGGEDGRDLQADTIRGKPERSREDADEAFSLNKVEKIPLSLKVQRSCSSSTTAAPPAPPQHLTQLPTTVAAAEQKQETVRILQRPSSADSSDLSKALITIDDTASSNGENRPGPSPRSQLPSSSRVRPGLSPRSTP